jgi:hypothetical protein
MLMMNSVALSQSSLFEQILSDKLPEVLDFSRDLANLEPASKVV